MSLPLAALQRKNAEQIDKEVKEIIDRAYETRRKFYREFRGSHQTGRITSRTRGNIQRGFGAHFRPRKTLSREQELVKELDEESHKLNQKHNHGRKLDSCLLNQQPWQAEIAKQVLEENGIAAV
jgi:hypothetical protein